MTVLKKCLFIRFSSSYILPIFLICISLISIFELSDTHFHNRLIFADTDNNINNMSNSLNLIQDSISKSSPSFGMHEMENTGHHWIDIWRGLPSNKGSNFNDIRSVNYFSDGQFLNATIWLDDFTPIPPTDRRVNYGIYIDSDFNNKTGIRGIDYKVEVQWHPESKSWTRVFEEWSTNGKNKTIEIKPNYTEFFQKGGSFVNLYADLKAMIYPQKYRVLFYAEEINLKGLSWIMDVTKWINIPSPKFAILFNPSTITLNPGEQKRIEVKVKSTTGLQSLVDLHVDNSSTPPFLNFKFTNDKLIVPSTVGESTTNLIISASGEAIRSPYTASISANLTFPPQEFNTPTSASRKLIIPTEDLTTYSSLPVTIGDFTTYTPINIHIPQEYLIGFYGIVLSLLLPAIGRWFTTKKQRKYIAKYMLEIEMESKSLENKEEKLEKLTQIRQKVSMAFANGKINDSNYKILDDKIKQYEDKLRS